MSGSVREGWLRLHAVFEPEIEIHVLGLESESAAKIHSATSNPVIRRTRKLAHISQSAAKTTAHVEVEAIEILSGGSGDSKSTKGKQEQYSLTQSRSPVSIQADSPILSLVGGWKGSGTKGNLSIRPSQLPPI